MNPAVLLVILCIGVISGASALDHNLDIEWEEGKLNHEKSYSLVGNLETVQKGSRVQVSRHIRGHRCPSTITTMERFLNHDYCEHRVARFPFPWYVENVWLRCPRIALLGL